MTHVTITGPNDARIAELFSQWQAQQAHCLTFPNVPNAEIDKLGQLEDEIAAMPADSARGLLYKARLYVNIHYGSTEAAEEEVEANGWYSDEMQAIGLWRDLERLAGKGI